MPAVTFIDRNSRSMQKVSHCSDVDHTQDSCLCVVVKEVCPSLHDALQYLSTKFLNPHAGVKTNQGLVHFMSLKTTSKGNAYHK